MTRTYYHRVQFGGNLPAFRGPALQRGYGLGGLFKGLARTLAPTLKRGLINVGKRALKTGTEVLNDYVQGTDLKTSLKRRAKENVNDMIRSAISNKSANTKSTLFSRSRTIKKRRGKSKRRKLDILD